ncbi:hypothetical protein EUGRSUZ_C01380 [Eucalyptus grandis]|uniref:Uncharacterized protein n=2 Tax=Eucalyptus grandis TaxID=71139 RepID=A0ACC3LDG9_EUCGR|nr:hypothetical protein EUGRSUZ_C01380 [Eucalyptus grandis]
MTVIALDPMIWVRAKTSPMIGSYKKLYFWPHTFRMFNVNLSTFLCHIYIQNAMKMWRGGRRTTLLAEKNPSDLVHVAPRCIIAGSIKFSLERNRSCGEDARKQKQKDGKILIGQELDLISSFLSVELGFGHPSNQARELERDTRKLPSLRRFPSLPF